jgi:hypothetical protein
VGIGIRLSGENHSIVEDDHAQRQRTSSSRRPVLWKGRQYHSSCQMSDVRCQMSDVRCQMSVVSEEVN